MKRVRQALARLATLAAFAEVSKHRVSRGPDDHLNVSPLSDDNLINSLKSARSSNPIKYDRKRAVRFEVNWKPQREVTITWTLDERSNRFNWYIGPWSRVEESTYSGSIATLRAENHGVGGFLSCAIYVDGQLLVPKDGDTFNPYMHRNDVGDCVVSVVIP